MLSRSCSILYFYFSLSNVLISSLVSAQSTNCQQEKIYRELQANIENGSDFFCSQFLQKVSEIGTLREALTLPFYKTVTDTKSKDDVYVYRSTTIKTEVTTTGYESQKRTAATFTAPLPSYVQQYPTPRVSKAWYVIRYFLKEYSCTGRLAHLPSSCLIPTPATYTQYRVCEQASTSTTVSTTLTYTVGRPGKTSTVDLIETETLTKSTSAAFPTACPAADNVSLALSVYP